MTHLQVVEFLLQQETRNCWAEVFGDALGGAVSAVRRTKGVVHIQIEWRGQRLLVRYGQTAATAVAAVSAAARVCAGVWCYRRIKNDRAELLVRDAGTH
jgi:hypothetical protein